ncbi:glycosyltransferase family 4 protein [Latilactobacillus sakei]|uniref:glycosyltransferase family 4 protein n=1 Tax=Latilactobacillus sakei TaxID=1599 RepID=UPI003F5299E2
MKILYVITRSTWGGAQAHLYELIKDRASKKDDVFLLVGEEGELADRVRKINSVNVKVDKILVRQLSPIKDLMSIYKIKSYIKKINPDIVHLHSSKAGAIGRIAAIGMPCKVIFTAHGWAFTEGINKVKRNVYIFIEKMLAKHTDEIICVSEYDYKLAKKENVIKKGINAKVIQNGVEEILNVESTKVNIPPVITMTARFDTQKNQNLLLEALSKLELPFVVNLIGDGPLRAECEEIVKNNGMEEKVNFLGFQRDVTSFLKETDIFVLISNYEGLPISIIEAMSCSLPIIASRVGGIPELIDNNINGFCIENDAKKISQVFEMLITDSDLRVKMGKASYRKYVSGFRIETNLSNIETVYKELIGEAYAQN